MGAIILFNCIFSLLLLISGGNGQKLPRSPVDCNTPGVECKYDEDTLINTIMQVPSVEECHQLCKDMEDCNFITYYDEAAFPVSKMCQLFRTCVSVDECSSCVSQNMDCLECGENIVGSLSDNVIEVIANTASEVKCKDMCLSIDNCSWFTYFFPNASHLHDYCFLLTEMLPPTEACQSCVSGPTTCDSSTTAKPSTETTAQSTAPPSNACLMQMNGEFHQHLMLTNITEAFSISVTGSESMCTLRVLAVGGGDVLTPVEEDLDMFSTGTTVLE